MDIETVKPGDLFLDFDGEVMLVVPGERGRYAMVYVGRMGVPPTAVYNSARMSPWDGTTDEDSLETLFQTKLADKQYLFNIAEVVGRVPPPEGE